MKTPNKQLVDNNAQNVSGDGESMMPTELNPQNDMPDVSVAASDVIATSLSPSGTMPLGTWYIGTKWHECKVMGHMENITSMARSERLWHPMQGGLYTLF